MEVQRRSQSGDRHGRAVRYPTVPSERIASTAMWRDAWWQWTTKAVHSSRNATGPLAAGHQAHWQDVAQDTQEWKNLEAEFVPRVTRTQREMHLLVGRWMMADADEELYSARTLESVSASKSAHNEDHKPARREKTNVPCPAKVGET